MKFFDFHHHHPAVEFGIYNLKFKEEIPEGFFSAGIHPHTISENLEEHFLWLKEVSKQKNCVAIGECGLDGLIETDEKLQEEVFEKQIYWGNELQKPIIIHCVKRFSKLSYFKKLAKVPMIIHGFNKRKTIGDELMRQDFHFSFGESVLYNVNLQQFLKEVPLNKIFLETDSAEFEIEKLYEKAASIKNIELENFTQKIKKNLHFLQISI